MQREHLIKGALCMTVGFFFVALSGAFFKAATVSASSLWSIFVAYTFAFVIQFIFIYKEGFAFLKTRRIGGYLGRVVFGVLSTLLYVIALREIPLMNATLLYNTAPLFVPILAIYMLGSKISFKIWATLCVGFIGVVFIIGPDFQALKQPENFVALTSGLVQALAFIFVKMLTHTEPVKRINFYFFFLSACLLSPFVLLSWETPPLESWVWSLSAGVSSFLAQLFIVRGYKYADASHVGAFQYASVIFSGIIGWLVWKQAPTLYDLIGVVFVILGGALAISLYKPSPKID